MIGPARSYSYLMRGHLIHVQDAVLLEAHPVVQQNVVIENVGHRIAIPVLNARNARFLKLPGTQIQNARKWCRRTDRGARTIPGRPCPRWPGRGKDRCISPGEKHVVELTLVYVLQALEPLAIPRVRRAPRKWLALFVRCPTEWRRSANRSQASGTAPTGHDGLRRAFVLMIAGFDDAGMLAVAVNGPRLGRRHPEYAAGTAGPTSPSSSSSTGRTVEVIRSSSVLAKS